MSLRVRFANTVCRRERPRRFAVAASRVALRIAAFFLTCACASFSLAADQIFSASPDENSSFLTGSGDAPSTSGSGLLTGMLYGDGNPAVEPRETQSAPAVQTPSAENPLGMSQEDLDRVARYETKQIGSSTIHAPKVQVRADVIGISAQYGWKGEKDEFGDVYVLYGDCRIEQGSGSASAPAAVVWIERDAEFGDGTVGTRVRAYLAKNDAAELRLDLNGVCTSAKTNGANWLGEFDSLRDADLRIAFPGENQLSPDEVYLRARNFLLEETASAPGGNLLQNRENQIVVPAPQNESSRLEPAPSQTSAPAGGALGWSDSGEGEVALIPQTSQTTDYFNQLRAPGAASRLRVQFFSRYDQEFSLSGRPKTSSSAEGDDKDSWFITSGFTVVIQGIAPENGNLPIGDVIELSADRATLWTRNFSVQDFSGVKTGDDLDLEIYLEGNVVFREGLKVVYADRMYYDVRNRVGVIEDAELIADVPEVNGAYFRIGAKRITQRGPDALYAKNAWITTSAMGRPTYRLQSDSIVAERRSTPLYDAATGRQLINSETGAFLTSDKEYIIAENNYVALGNLPVFYWPWMAMDVKDRSLYLRHVRFGHDNVLGTQIRTTWNPWQLFGMSKIRPEGTDWDLNLDYLSKRGFGHGMTFVYDRDSICKWDTRAVGMANFYGIYDNGTDNLGRDRRSLDFPHKYRYRGIWKHRQELGTLDCGLNLFDNCCIRDGWTLTGEFGKSSDRNYLPQYFEDEWNSSSNPETSIELKRTVNNRSLSVMASARTDKFYTQTSWLPRFDHYWLGQALGQSNLAWYEHTKIGFAQFRTADSPTAADDAALFRYLDWELANSSTDNVAGADGTSILRKDSLVFTTRHELDLPFQLGPVKTTPYALGEYGFWGRGMESKNVSRVYGRLGVRFNLPIWKVDSDVQSRTWYVNGLAHKMNLTADVSYSAANKDYSDLVLFDQVDDWQVEDFRRRYSVTTFAGKGAGYSDALPLRFDERYYAIRQGDIGGNVTAASELADDLQLVRLGWDNRWQTKRGPAGARRVVDWITFSAGLNLYPKKSQNFGRVPGLLDYDAAWQLGDRFAILSSGLYDFWGSGQKITRLGVQRKRPGLSSCFLGIDRLAGPITATYLNFGLTYRTSERWGLGFSNSFDLNEGHNIGQKVTVSRIGESFVFTLGASRNESKDNWGISLSVEPVFMFDKDKKEEGLLGLGNM